jgi:twitching motility protein PilI
MTVSEAQLILMRELLVIHVKGSHYGIWKDTVSVKHGETLHRLPLAPDCIAGISIIDDRTVTLADLPACIGYDPGNENRTGSILVLSGQEKITGFLVNRDIGSLAVPREAVVPLPDYVKTDAMQTCAIHDDCPIPIIDVYHLHSHILKDQDPPRPSFLVPRRERLDIAALSSARVFRLDDELYALSSSGVEEQTITPARIVGMPLVPQFIRGITCHEGGIFPVVDLSQRIRRKKTESGRMLIQKINGAGFGLLIGEDRGTVPASEFMVAPLPPIAGSAWLNYTVIIAGQIVPLVDPSLLLSINAEGSEERHRETLYTPASPFPALFKKQDADVVEFSLLGARHALPKSEVEDVIDFRPYRQIPGAPPIVVGVAEYRGLLLPVLDLALVFGRRSLVTTGWRMMLVKNGDFRALVITESVYGERRLPLDIQRNVPIRLPHRVVYGCYPDADAVRLILNVEALTVHFEKSLVRELLPAMPQEMKRAPAELVPSLLDDQAIAAIKSEAEAEAEAIKPMGPVSLYPKIAAPVSAGTGGQLQKIDAKTEVPRDVMQKEQKLEAEIEETARETQTAEPVLQSYGGEQNAALQQDMGASNAPANIVSASLEGTETSAEEQRDASFAASEEVVEIAQKKINEEPVTTEEAQSITDTAGDAGAEEASVESGPVAETGRDAISSSMQKEREGATASVFEPQHEPESAEPEEPISGEFETQRIDEDKEAGKEPEQKPQREPELAGSEEPASSEFETRSFIEEKEPRKVPEQKPQPQRGEQVIGRQEAEQPVMQVAEAVQYASSDKGWKRRIIIGTITAVFAGMVYVLGIPHKPGTEKQVNERAPAKVEQAKIETKASSHTKQEPPLVIEVPSVEPANIDVYVVIQGDTLWSISKRFTGNPFNYPRIAGENRIANPDLIFPGQKIALKKK